MEESSKDLAKFFHSTLNSIEYKPEMLLTSHLAAEEIISGKCMLIVTLKLKSGES